MSVEGVFRMNSMVDSRLIDELMVGLGTILGLAFPLSRGMCLNPDGNCKSLLHARQQSIEYIVCMSRNLSFIMQHDNEVYRLLVSMGEIDQYKIGQYDIDIAKVHSIIDRHM
jgi:hypothetical protein